MTIKDDFRQVAKAIKRELDQDRLAFKTYQRERFATELRARAGSGAHKKGTTTDADMGWAFMQEGLLIYPPLDADTASDGYTRVFRSGSRIASILNALRFPGGGSDEELAILLGKLRPPRFEGGEPQTEG
jgi:hypothetical protein